ncbi:hypothetical protein Egran_00739 [Elaphomyces granulatus]|uniref:Uncharacterized protein n=1 Tax=Elaphomyces granulatus TaxID=519963 RepID=A0A232M4Y8_9EURO|nr:hypothetical protein Egran_00739 [Elaphomyces granulatus]
MSSIASDYHDRLEPRLLRAADNNDTDALKQIVKTARSNGQLNDSFLGLGLLRSSERGCIDATKYLLSEGAKTDVLSNRLSPLFRAVEKNHVTIVQNLLNHGASLEARNKKGRTALMTAAWKNHLEILRILILGGADVNARDLRKRNVLHNLAADRECAWGDEVVHLIFRANCMVDGEDAHDVLGRTPLHWACATGKAHLAEKLLTRSEGPKAEVNGVEFRNKTALHIAAAHDRHDIVELLLRHHADVNSKSDGGWTPLHNACDKGCEKIVRILLKAGANLNGQLLNGITPLHLAAQGGHRDVVECLMERPDLKRRTRDTFGSTPFLRAAQFKRRDIVRLLAPFNHIEALSEDAVGACKGFEATIVDFGNFHNENRVKKVTVFDLLYGRDPENPRKQAIEALPDNVKAANFRWIHLPANNMAWVESLHTKCFIEEGANDVEGFKGLEKLFNYQHRGRHVHSQFMRPLCQSTLRTPLNREEGQESQSEDKILRTEPSSSNASPENSVKRTNTSSGKLERLGSSSQDESTSQGKKARGTAKRPKAAHDYPKRDQKHKPSVPGGGKRKPRSVYVSPPTMNDQICANTSNICIFMPYLHFETVERRQKMQEVIQRAGKLSFYRSESNPSTRDEMLIRAHLNCSTTSLHIRRTLDQYFYPNIDTQSRDEDQVVYRYQAKDGNVVSKEPKIFMVDQLWMWILGGKLIVTCFPQRWEQPKNDPLNVLDGIIEDINSKTRDHVQSVYDLAIVITNRCSGIFDRHRMGDESYQFLDMFESSIGIATDHETVLFKEFNASSAQASEWLAHHRGLRQFPWSLESTQPQQQNNAWKPGEKDRQPVFVDRLLDIGQETNLLAETKDIRDELNMIHNVLEQQKQVLFDLQESICEIHLGEHRSQQEIKKRFREQQRVIDMHVKDLDRMDKQTEQIYVSITDLLDLKQKHANAFEARFARDQAAGTARQGKTIMMFTIVTIVFLPLSFMTSLFAINIREFPRASDGSPDLHFSFVAQYTFGIGFAISIPLIIIALSVGFIRRACQGGYRRALRWKNKRSLSDNNGMPLFDLRHRRSLDSTFSTGVLPISMHDLSRSRKPHTSATTDSLVGLA